MENLSEQLLASGQYAKALKLFETALKEDSKDIELYYGKGEALYWLGQSTEALACYQAVLEMDPQHIKALVGKGNALRVLGQNPYQKALEAIESALKINENDAEALLAKGKILSELGQSQEAHHYCIKALAGFNSILTINDKDSRILHRIGQCHQLCLEEKHFETAFVYFSKAAELGNTGAQLYLSDCYDYGQGVEINNETGWNLFFKAHSTAANEGNPVSQFILARIYESGINCRRDEEQAVKWYIESGQNIFNDISKLPEKNRFDFACAHQHKIRNGIVLAKVLNKLPEEKRLIFAQAHQHRIQFGMNLPEVLRYLPQEKRLEFVRGYKKTISASEVEEITALLPKAERFVFLNDHIDKILDRPRSELLSELLLGGCSKAVSEGDPDAKNVLGYCYGHGLYLSKNEEQATKWYIESGQNIYNDISELPEKNRFDFACAHQYKIRNGIVLAKVLGLLPEDNRLIFAQTNQDKIKYGMNLPELLTCLSQEERFSFALANQSNIQRVKGGLSDSNQLPKILQQLCIEKRVTFIQSLQVGVYDVDELTLVLAELPNEGQLIIAEAYLQEKKISDYYFVKIVEQLNKEIRLQFANNHFDLINTDFYLGETLLYLPEEKRLEFVRIYKGPISASNVAKITALLPRAERLIFVNDHIDKILNNQNAFDRYSSFEEILDLLPEEARFTLGNPRERLNKIKNGFELALLLKQFPMDERFNIACSHQSKVGGYSNMLGSDLAGILRQLPEDKQLSFIEIKKDKLNIPRGHPSQASPFLRILTTLSVKDRFKLAQEYSSYTLEYGQYSSRDPLWYGAGSGEYRDLTNLLKLLLEENRLVIATHHQANIFSTAELVSVLNTLSPIDQLSLTVDYLTTKRQEKKDISSADLETIKDFFAKQHHSLSFSKFSDIDIAINSIKVIKDNSNQIRKTAETLARYYRNQNLLFSKIPLELTHKIASLTGNLQIHSEKEAAKMAIPCFELPQDFAEETSKDVPKIRN
jgi:TPR repeat protein